MAVIRHEDSVHSVYTGDMLDVLPKKAWEEQVHLVFTSPPYNFGFNYGEHYNDAKSWDAYYEQFNEWLPMLYSMMAPGGRLCLMHYFSCGTAQERVTPLMTLNDMAKSHGFHHHAVIFWYDRTISRRTAWGSWMLPSAPYVQSPIEGILVLNKGDWKRKKPRFNAESTISREEFMKGALGIWDDIGTERERTGNPAPFPVPLARRAIEMFTWTGDVVLDPFCGSGTTSVAALQTGRHSIGIDIEESQTAHTIERLLNEGGEYA